MTSGVYRFKSWFKWIVLALLLALLVPFLPQLAQLVGAILRAIASLIGDLVGIGILALFLLILLIPLETLGWWAGWYGDPIQTTREHSGTFQKPLAVSSSISRYVVYLDYTGLCGGRRQRAIAPGCFSPSTGGDGCPPSHW